LKVPFDDDSDKIGLYKASFACAGFCISMHAFLSAFAGIYEARAKYASSRR
jgi:hypothetical protein